MFIFSYALNIFLPYMLKLEKSERSMEILWIFAK